MILFALIRYNTNIAIRILLLLHSQNLRFFIKKILKILRSLLIIFEIS